MGELKKEVFEWLDDLPIGLWVARVPTGDVVYANRAFDAILGMKPVEGATIEEAPATYGIFDRDGRPYPADRLPFARALAEAGPVVVDDLAIHRRDGRRVAVRAWARPVGACVVVAFADVTADIEAAQRLAFAVQNSPVVVWLTDAAGIVTFSEGAALRGLGFAPGELVGKSVFELYRDRPDMLEQYRQVFSGERVATTNDVGSVTLEAVMSPWRGADGAVNGAIGVATDVTESRRLERQLVNDDRIRAMGTLAASVAHEINNPLTYVLGNLQLAHDFVGRLGTATSSAELREGLENVRRLLAPALAGAERMSRLTHDLRTFTRDDADAAASADVAKAVTAVLDLVRNQVETRARLRVDVRPTPAVRTSEGRLVQVFLNLLVNAWQALPTDVSREQNEVGVVVYSEADPENAPEQPRAVIEISDSGRGVAAADRERIFEPFTTTKAIGENSGLGLFVCRNLVRAAGGEISVHQRPGGGAVFRVVLPAAQLPLKIATPAPAATPIEGRILIVDDEPPVAKVLAAKLELAGFATVVRHGGVEALELLLGDPDADSKADSKIDLVYCDVMMKTMTGIELYERVRQDAPNLISRIVLMTGGVFSDGPREFLEANAAIVVEKPFDVVEDARRRLSTRRGSTERPPT